uniref:Uncharacterized protein n=1 Tax=Pristionchus pacificus TaxID=54126 RepID=A0A2A6BJX0_PRIPA|eukprot:PDM66215.1 hypothetical protein PRIPAC_45440 [Pristionchus pacificus]
MRKRIYGTPFVSLEASTEELLASEPSPEHCVHITKEKMEERRKRWRSISEVMGRLVGGHRQTKEGNRYT